MRIIVTDRADVKLQETVNYIREEYGGRARQKFIHEFHFIMKLLMKNPNMGPAEPLLANRPTLYRSIVMNRQNKIVYRVTDDSIEIVDFWDTRREPKEQAGYVT